MARLPKKYAFFDLSPKVVIFRCNFLIFAAHNSYAMQKDNSGEIFPIVNAEGRVIGSATRGECHGGSMLLHPVVHLHLFNTRGELFLQKRPEWKDIQPGRWDTAVGGHIDFGEETLSALRREVREEIGITDFNPLLITSYIFRSDREREYVNVFATVSDTPPRPSDELDGGRFMTITEIEAAIGSSVFTPNFENEYLTVLRPWLTNRANQFFRQ